MADRARGRQRESHPEGWLCNLKRDARQHGHTLRDPKDSTHILVPGKTLGNLCKCKLKCHTQFTRDQRRDLFTNFWILNKDRQDERLLGYRSQSVKQRRRPRARGGRLARSQGPNYLWHVENKRVCKAWIQSTFSVGEKRLRLLKDQPDMRETVSVIT